jgi:hypothetical protein
MDLRPLALGELVDRSATFWRAHWKPLFQLYLGFQLVQYLFLRLFELAARQWFPLLRGGRAMQDALRSDPDVFLRQMVLAAPALIALIVLVTLMGFACSTAGSAYVVPILYGQTATVGSALKKTRERILPIIGLVALSYLWVIGWSIGVSLPAIALAAIAAVADNRTVGALAAILIVLWTIPAMIVVFLGYLLRFAAAAQVLAMESASALVAYKRSGVLSSGRIGEGFLNLVKVRLTLVITVVGVILLVVSLLTSLPAIIIQGVYGNAFDPANADPDAVPQALLVPAQLLQIVAGSLVTPLFVVAMGWYYVDMRMRREGLDLELKLGGKA